MFHIVSDFAKIFVNPSAIGFGETFGRLSVIILKKLRINSFNNHAAPFNLSFVENRKSKLDTTYIIEASHDLKKWGEIGEVQGTGSSVKFTDWWSNEAPPTHNNRSRDAGGVCHLSKR